MVEMIIGQTVERKFQDEYASRPYARVPLSKTGVDTEAFVACIKSRLGECYDDLEALTLGEIDDPAKQMCSDLAADCLPEETRRKIAKARRLGLLKETSVSIHSPPNALNTKVFVSPNGFAQYFNAPGGRKIREKDVLVEPQPLEPSARRVVRKQGWKIVLYIGTTWAVTAGLFFLLGSLKNNKASGSE